MNQQSVIPAKAGIQSSAATGGAGETSHWIPAFAGMTGACAGMTGAYAGMTAACVAYRVEDCLP